MTQRVAVTGASGFIGKHLVAKLVAGGHDIRAMVRSEEAACKVSGKADVWRIDSAGDADCWDAGLSDCDAVVHLIGVAHAAAHDKKDLTSRFHEVNVNVTGRVVDACLRNGVHRLIYLSSIKAVGEGGPEPYTEASECLPENPYGASKREAEQMILERTRGCDIEASILRPPVVYGPHVKGNIARMLKLVQSGIPLPIRCLKARRSMLYVGNLVDAIRCMIESEHPIGGIYHIADAEMPPTTREFLLDLGRLMGRRVVEVPVPASLLRMAGRLVGMGEEVKRLTSPLTTHGSRFWDELGWSAPISMQQGLAATVDWFVNREGAA